MKLRSSISVAALFLAVGLGVWLLLTLSHDPPARTPSSEAPRDLEARLEELSARREEQTKASPSKVDAKKPRVEPEVFEVHSHAVDHRSYDPERHPHPITAQHLHIQHENQLIQAMNDAMDLKDPGELRRVLAMYRSSHPEDAHALQRGYEVIADCLEYPSAQARSAGERYMEEERASTLRRMVRRHCVQAIDIGN